jgi:hypothetical protein
MQHFHHSFIQTKHHQALIGLICMLIGTLVIFVFGFYWRAERTESTFVATAFVLKAYLPETQRYHARLCAQSDPQFVELVLRSDADQSIKLGQHVELKAQSSDADVISGQIQTIEQRAEQLYLGIVLDREGMQVDLDQAEAITLSILSAEQREALFVPDQALQRRDGRSFVEVRWAAGEPAVPIAVETGASQAGYTEIVSCSEIGWQCLEVGDEVVLRATP